jgi:hypothetical protein
LTQASLRRSPTHIPTAIASGGYPCSSSCSNDHRPVARRAAHSGGDHCW